MVYIEDQHPWIWIYQSVSADGFGCNSGTNMWAIDVGYQGRPSEGNDIIVVMHIKLIVYTCTHQRRLTWVHQDDGDGIMAR